MTWRRNDFVLWSGEKLPLSSKTLYCCLLLSEMLDLNEQCLEMDKLRRAWKRIVVFARMMSAIHAFVSNTHTAAHVPATSVVGVLRERPPQQSQTPAISSLAKHPAQPRSSHRHKTDPVQTYLTNHKKPVASISRNPAAAAQTKLFPSPPEQTP